MPTNPYFNKTTVKSEQTLVQDLVDESIKIHGIDMVYLPRTLVNVDEILVKTNCQSLKRVSFLRCMLKTLKASRRRRNHDAVWFGDQR